MVQVAFVVLYVEEVKRRYMSPQILGCTKRYWYGRAIVDEGRLSSFDCPTRLPALTSKRAFLAICFVLWPVLSLTFTTAVLHREK